QQNRGRDGGRGQTAARRSRTAISPRRAARAGHLPAGWTVGVVFPVRVPKAINVGVDAAVLEAKVDVLAAGTFVEVDAVHGVGPCGGQLGPGGGRGHFDPDSGDDAVAGRHAIVVVAEDVVAAGALVHVTIASAAFERGDGSRPVSEAWLGPGEDARGLDRFGATGVAEVEQSAAGERVEVRVYRIVVVGAAAVYQV